MTAPHPSAILTARLRALCWFSATYPPGRKPKRLQRSVERFRLMADNAPVLIWMAGLDKGCTWFNRPWLDFVGRTMEQELGGGWSENVHPDELDRCLNTRATSFDARQPFTLEYRLKRHDGEYRWVLENGAPLYIETGEV